MLSRFRHLFPWPQSLVHERDTKFPSSAHHHFANHSGRYRKKVAIKPWAQENLLAFPRKFLPRQSEFSRTISCDITFSAVKENGLPFDRDFLTVSDFFSHGLFARVRQFEAKIIRLVSNLLQSWGDEIRPSHRVQRRHIFSSVWESSGGVIWRRRRRGWRHTNNRPLTRLANANEKGNYQLFKKTQIKKESRPAHKIFSADCEIFVFGHFCGKFIGSL